MDFLGIDWTIWAIGLAIVGLVWSIVMRLIKFAFSIGIILFVLIYFNII